MLLFYNEKTELRERVFSKAISTDENETSIDMLNHTMKKAFTNPCKKRYDNFPTF